MQRAGNLVFRVLAVPLRAEVFPLYQAQAKLSLCCPGSHNSAKFSVEANITDPVKDLAPSQCHTTTSLVTQFSRLSAAHNPRVEENLPDLSPFADDLEANLTLLTFDQLQDLVYALTLWPEARRTSTTLKQVPNKLEESLRRIFDLLKLESNRRLAMKFVGEERFISLSNENFQSVLPFASLWAKLDIHTPLKDAYDIHTNSFYSNVVNRIGDSAGGVSTSRFRYFTKDTFVSFMELVKVTQLRKDKKFHTYYCTVKFNDLFDQMDQEDIGKVCATFTKKNICHGSRHPMDIRIKEKILAFLLLHRHDVTSENIWSMSLFLQLGSMPENLHDKLVELQNAIVQDGLAEKLSLKAIFGLLSVTSLACSTKLVDIWILRALSSPTLELAWCSSGLEAREMGDVGRTVALQRDTPAGRALLLRLSSLLAERMQVEADPRQFVRPMIRLLLALAQVGLYPAEELQALFTSSALVDEEGRILKPIVFGSKAVSTKTDITGGLLSQLIGMASLESKYVPPVHPDDLERLTRLHSHSDTPLEVRRGGKDFAHLLDRRWVRVGLEINDALVEVVGDEDKVWETYVLPFTGILCYLVLVREGRATIIPEEMKNQPLLTTKKFDGPEGDGTWVAFYPTNGQFFRASHTKNGGTEVTARLLAKMGVKAAELEVVDWEEVEEEISEPGETLVKGVDRERTRKDVTAILKSIGWSDENITSG